MSTRERSAPAVLVVEDDPAIAAGIVRGLKGAGFDVELAHDGRRGAELALARPFDLVVLDLMLPELGGFEVLELWRGRLSTPVIVLSARTELDARLQAFAGGAVDYLPKPFWIEELLARVRARLRLPDAAAPTRTFGWDGALLDLDARTVTLAGEPLGLTAHEFNVLLYLVERPARAITRRQLAEAALPAGGDRSERTVDSHVARIRRKLGPAGARIATVWGIGYRFDAPEPA
ncbi:response regulator transcription factor [Nannocystis sp. ILAH1]|uniref:response regulator transcription factor n=1 Tax=unclassified Nannocystis TaxID=2627009 RepID=UPI00226F6001|nr:MULTISPECIES: response regulator transcription factor [unclassified Nannocystis]MCY0991641.1 response regulator transcription factor [Nannocystis sp. ILAH1]MCY1066693.1 response regulator transcription factor [Nannocystis sp. RBIL2]